ncbi:MAG: hypothetical protein J6K04_13180 [Lachnospiraceae bacterium]|nr:hypothetical protein [Lachnospiraceae bacterium]
MKKANGLIVGVIFILLGLLYGCSALGIFDFSIFFPGWWTLFIIIPCIYALTKKNEDKTGPVIGLVIGLCFLINAQDWRFHIDFWPLAVAVLLIVIGVKIMFPDKKKNHKQVEFTYNSENGEKKVEVDGVTFDNTYTKSNGGYVNVSAILGGKDIRVDNECFTGADICVVMGAIDLDLRNAIISEDVYVNVSAVMGGIDIYVPANVRVVTDGCSTIMGGIDVNTSYVNYHSADTPKLIFTGSCVMGGIEIK